MPKKALEPAKEYTGERNDPFFCPELKDKNVKLWVCYDLDGHAFIDTTQSGAEKLRTDYHRSK